MIFASLLTLAWEYTTEATFSKFRSLTVNSETPVVVFGIFYLPCNLAEVLSMPSTELYSMMAA